MRVEIMGNKGGLKTRKVQAIILVVIGLVIIGGGYLYMTTVATPKKIIWYAAMLEDEWVLYKPIVDEFTKETGTKVEVKLYGGAWGELSEKLKAEVEAGKGVADVVTIDDFAVTTTRDYVYDLTGEVEAWGEWDDLYAGKKRSGVFEKRIYFVPWRADALTMYVNTEKLAEHGLEPPETMEELLIVARTLYEREGIGRVGVKAKKYEGLTCEVAIFIKAYGGDYLKFNSEPNVEAFEFLQDLGDYLHPDSKTWDEGTIPASISGEEIYINFNWPYQAAILEKEGLAGKIKAFPTPRGPIGRGTTLGGGFLAVSKASPHKDLAWEFVKFLASKRGQGLQLDHIGWLPIRDDAWDYLYEVYPEKYMILMPYRETLKYGLARPAIVDYPELTELWQNAFWEIVWEGKPVGATLDRYQAICESRQICTPS